MRAPAVIAVALVALALSGCAKAPEAPTDAVVVMDDRLPGLTLSAWIEERGGYTYLRAVAQNDGADLATKEDCGYLWQSELRLVGSNATLPYERPVEEVCDWWHHTMRSGEHREFLHSWDGVLWVDEDGEPAPPGSYTWTIRFLLREGSDHETMSPIEGRHLTAVVPFTRA